MVERVPVGSTTCQGQIEEYKFRGGLITAEIVIESLDGNLSAVKPIRRVAMVNNLIFWTPRKSFCFDLLLPKGWRFADAGRNPDQNLRGPRVEKDKKLVYVPLTPSCQKGNSDEFWYPGITFFGMRLATLHEITHAIVYSKMPDEEYQRLAVETYTHYLARQKAKKVPENIKNLFITDERNAWAGAIRYLRQLRQNDVDLEPYLSVPQIRNFAHGYLDA